MLASFNINQLEDPKTPVYLCTWDEGIIEVHTKQSLIETYLDKDTGLENNNDSTHISSYGDPEHDEWDYESFRDYLDNNDLDFTIYMIQTSSPINHTMTIERIN